MISSGHVQDHGLMEMTSCVDHGSAAERLAVGGFGGVAGGEKGVLLLNWVRGRARARIVTIEGYS